MHMADWDWCTLTLKFNFGHTVFVVQFSSKVTFTHIPDTSCTCFASGKKGQDTHICLAATLLQGFALTGTHFVHVPDTSCTHFRHVSDTCRQYLKSELYRTWFVLHPQIVPHCSTIWRVLSLFLEIISIVLHPQIVSAIVPKVKHSCRLVNY